MNTMNFITAAQSQLKNVAENVLIKISTKENNYQFEIADEHNEVEKTWEVVQSVLKNCCSQQTLQNYTHTLPTKQTLRELFVQAALFTKDGPLLQPENLKALKKIFLDTPMKLKNFRNDKVKTSGKGFTGLCEKVYLQWHHYFQTQSEKDSVKKTIREAEFLTSRMGDREMRVGEYIYLDADQIYLVDAVIAKEGAYVAILKNVNDPKSVKIVCRGTALRKGATEGLKSGLNDLQYEIGNGGTIAVWPEVADYLKDYAIKKVEIYGKSLGGAHAQRLAILVMGHSEATLQSLTTVAAVGVGQEAEVLFRKLIDTAQIKPKITVIRNSGDYIPCLGGDHLGSSLVYDLNPKVYYIHSEEEIEKPNDKQSFWKKAKMLISSFSAPHVRQATLNNDFYVETIKNENKQEALKLGALMERQRRWAAYRTTILFKDFATNPSAPWAFLTLQKIGSKASVLFTLLFAAGFISAIVLKPGAPFIQAPGITLTEPALFLATGCMVSLTLFVITSVLAQRTRHRAFTESF